jgi:hypothetical protein
MTETTASKNQQYFKYVRFPPLVFFVSFCILGPKLSRGGSASYFHIAFLACMPLLAQPPRTPPPKPAFQLVLDHCLPKKALAGIPDTILPCYWCLEKSVSNSNPFLLLPSHPRKDGREENWLGTAPPVQSLGVECCACRRPPRQCCQKLSNNG